MAEKTDKKNSSIPGRDRTKSAGNPHVSVSAARPINKATDDNSKRLEAYVVCPITRCNNFILPTTLLSHFITAHVVKQNHPVRIIETHIDQKIRIIIAPITPSRHRTQCLAILAFVGSSRKDLPGQIGLCRPNNMLPEDYHKMKNCLPVMVMATKCTWRDLVKSKGFKLLSLERQNEPFERKNFVYIVWLLTEAITQPLYATLSLYDHARCLGQSNIVRCHEMWKGTDPMAIITDDGRCLRINDCLIARLERDGKRVETEIILRDFRQPENEKK